MSAQQTPTLCLKTLPKTAPLLPQSHIHTYHIRILDWYHLAMLSSYGCTIAVLYNYNIHQYIVGKID